MKISVGELPVWRWKESRDIRLKALRSDAIAFGKSFSEEKNYPPNIWKNYLRKKHAIYIFVDDMPVGMLAMKPYTGVRTRHIATLVGMYISKEHRGKGLGDILLKEMIRRIKKKGYKKIELDVNTRQLPAIRLYKKNGFRKVGIWKKELFVNGRYYDEYFMEKLL